MVVCCLLEFLRVLLPNVRLGKPFRLMNQNSAQQEKKFAEAFNQYSDALFRHSFFRVSNRQVSIDLVQDAFTKTWMQIVKGEDIANLQAYLYHVLNNLIIDYYRKKKSVSLDALSDDGFDPAGSGEAEIIANAEHNQLMKNLEMLPERDREVVVMRYVDGLPVKNIAELLGESENGVSVRLHRAIKKLTVLFDTHGKSN